MARDGVRLDLAEADEFSASCQSLLRAEIRRRGEMRPEQAAGVWVFGGGLDEDVEPVMVAGDETVTNGTYPIGGLSVVDVPSREAALEWAAKIAVACRCAQELSAFHPDPAVAN
jgi:hypothetical protein